MARLLLLLARGIIILTACCVATNANPLVTGNLCSPPCVAKCSPQCLPSCCVGPAGTPCAPKKQEFMISSVEEGETEECADDKGFNSPSDNSADPPGTITIPLPPTMYTPPKPGEAPKELPLPDFKLPASFLQGKMPTQSMVLNPEPAASNAPLLSVSPKLVAPAPPAPPPPPPAPPPPPPPSPSQLALPPVASGYPLRYPKLPPITFSEIPGRSNRYPPLPNGVAANPGAVINAPKLATRIAASSAPGNFPPSVNYQGGVSPVGPSVSGAGVIATCVTSSCYNKPWIDPVTNELTTAISTRTTGI